MSTSCFEPEMVKCLLASIVNSPPLRPGSLRSSACWMTRTACSNRRPSFFRFFTNLSKSASRTNRKSREAAPNSVRCLYVAANSPRRHAPLHWLWIDEGQANDAAHRLSILLNLNPEKGLTFTTDEQRKGSAKRPATRRHPFPIYETGSTEETIILSKEAHRPATFGPRPPVFRWSFVSPRVSPTSRVKPVSPDRPQNTPGALFCEALVFRREECSPDRLPSVREDIRRSNWQTPTSIGDPAANWKSRSEARGLSPVRLSAR